MMSISGCQPTCAEREGRAWFCIRSQAKREHIAGAHLLDLNEIDVFNPRLRRRQRTRRGMVWVTESLFPGYLFAQFDLRTTLDRVLYTVGVAGVVRFGRTYPSISKEVIDGLKREFPEEALTIQKDDLRPGTEVTLVSRPWHGLQGIVLRNLPARNRVQVLMDMLGSPCKLEVDAHSLVIGKGVPCQLSLDGAGGSRAMAQAPR